MEQGHLAVAAKPAPRLRRRDLGEMFLRSFFFQTLWNFKRFQNMGFLFTIWPALRRFYPDKNDRAQAALDHFDYFNTHPNLANLIVGVTAGMEEECAAGQVKRDSILAAKKFMSGPLAALGDALFWAVARPLLGMTAMAAGWYFFPRRWWAIPVIFLATYNVFHLTARWMGLSAGYHRRTQVVPYLMALNLQKAVDRAYGFGLILSTLAIAWFYISFGSDRTIAAIFVTAGVLAMRGGVSSSRVFYAIVLAGTVYGYIRALS